MNTSGLTLDDAKNFAAIMGAGVISILVMIYPAMGIKTVADNLSGYGDLVVFPVFLSLFVSMAVTVSAVWWYSFLGLQRALGADRSKK